MYNKTHLSQQFFCYTVRDNISFLNLIETLICYNITFGNSPRDFCHPCPKCILHHGNFPYGNAVLLFPSHAIGKSKVIKNRRYSWTFKSKNYRLYYTVLFSGYLGEIFPFYTLVGAILI